MPGPHSAIGESWMCPAIPASTWLRPSEVRAARCVAVVLDALATDEADISLATANIVRSSMLAGGKPDAKVEDGDADDVGGDQEDTVLRARRRSTARRRSILQKAKRRSMRFINEEEQAKIKTELGIDSTVNPPGHQDSTVGGTPMGSASAVEKQRTPGGAAGASMQDSKAEATGNNEKGQEPSSARPKLQRRVSLHLALQAARDTEAEGDATAGRDASGASDAKSTHSRRSSQHRRRSFAARRGSHGGGVSMV